jgi:hypothetical protein
MRARNLGWCMVALAVAGPAQAKVGAVAVQWGEVDAEVVGPMDPAAKLKALSPGQTVRDAQFTRRTDQIEARLCGRFGVAAWLTAGPDEPLPPMVGVSVRHPKITRPDGESSAEDSFYTPVIGGEVAAFFSFENQWEMEPGIWTFEFRNGDTLLASRAFTVTKRPGPTRSACDEPPTS